MKKVFRPWGDFRLLFAGDKFWVKVLMIKRAKRTSMQYHYDRVELHFVLSGKVRVESEAPGDVPIAREFCSGEYYVLSPMEHHRIENVGHGNASIAEIAFGKPRESDIIRVADDYGRKCEKGGKA